jgi:N6-adenosine-specific RNA methylase IME4
VKYGAILIDPPVPFECWSDASAWGGVAAAHYGLMTWQDLAALGPTIDAVALPDACLFLWVCAPLVPETLRMAEAWGWQYKTTAFTWVKTTRDSTNLFRGMGYWTRANAESVWLFTRGHPKRTNKDVAQALHTEAVVTQRGSHSVKPEEVATRIERLVDGPYLEMFARRRREGWTTIGNELDGLDIRDSLARVAADEPLPALGLSLLDMAEPPLFAQAGIEL